MSSSSNPKKDSTVRRDTKHLVNQSIMLDLKASKATNRLVRVVHKSSIFQIITDLKNSLD